MALVGSEFLKFLASYQQLDLNEKLLDFDNIHHHTRMHRIHILS
jgi:hypothetical protein